MPATASNISPEVSRKKLVKADNSIESKKSIPQMFDMKTTDSAICGTQGDTPAKKTTKTTKQGNKGGRRVSSAVNDAPTKKNAQKAKGSLALNKADQPEGDQKPKRAPQELVQSSDPVLPQMAQSHSGTRGTGGEPRKSNVPVRIKGRSKRAPPKEAKTPSKQKFAVPPATEQPGGAPTRDKPHEAEPSPAGKDEDIHTVSPVGNSYSFFERIQQGVKAYFGSRGSFNNGDRNKKEGGGATNDPASALPEWPGGCSGASGPPSPPRFSRCHTRGAEGALFFRHFWGRGWYPCNHEWSGALEGGRAGGEYTLEIPRFKGERLRGKSLTETVRPRSIEIVGGKRKVPSPAIQTRAVDKLEHQSDQCLGIRTRARVAKGVTEDAKKRKPGKIVKNKKQNIYSESDSFFGRIRLNSSLGGQSNHFLSTKPKIFRHFRKLKRKKLYRPKKHYVSIQIPRKGYFYRSTVQFRSQEPSSTALRRLERLIEPENSSKAEVSRLASTSSEVSHLPNEKTVTGEQKQVVEVRIPKWRAPKRAAGPEPEPPDQLSLDLLERLNRAVNDEGSSYPFRHMLDEYLSSHWPSKPLSEEALSLDDVASDFVNPQAIGNGQTSAISENPSSSNFQETENWWRTWPRVGDDFSDILSICSNFPMEDNQSTCALQIPPYKPFETLLYPVTPAFSRELPMRYLKTPSLSLIREESPLAIENECGPREEDLLRAGAHTSIPQGEQVRATPEDLPPDDLPFTESFKSLNNNFQIEFPSLDRSGGDSQNDREDYLEVVKSGSTFASAVSVLSQQIPPWNLEGAPCLKGFLSLTKIPQKSCGVRKSKSESDLKALKNGVSGKAMRFPHVSEGLNDGYEKILPLGMSKAAIEAKKGGRGSLLSFEVAEEAPEETSGSSEEASEGASDEASDEESPLEDEDPALTNYHEMRGWSPTLPELTEIYDSILKENKKLQRKGLIPEQCLSSYMMSFLQKKLTEKRLRMELVDFSKSFRDSFRPKYWKPGKVKDYSFGLEEYVAAFQEILHSNLSVKQIIGLNDALSTFQDYHDQTHLFLTDQAAKTGKRKAKKHGKAKPTADEIQKIKLPTPTDLETVLKKFNSEDLEVKEDKNKLMVTVKLSGNQVLVNSLTYFNDEDNLTPKKKGKSKRVSELIIENLSKQSGEKPADQNPSKTPKQEKQEPVEVKMPKSYRNEEPVQVKKEVPEFHYDQLLLRAQHPIEAIVEGTEPKPKEERGRSRGNSLSKEKPKSAGHNEVKSNKGNPRGFRDKLQSAFSGKIYLKDLFHEFSREDVGKPIQRTGSTGAGAQAKRFFSATKKKAETVRSMFELKKSPSGKCPKPRSTYLCYPSVMSFQEKTTKKIKDKSRYCNKGTVPPTTYKPKLVPTRNVTRPVSKWEPNKKPTREPEPTPSRPQTSNVSTATTGTMAAVSAVPQKHEEPNTSAPAAQGSELPKVAECCSIELLVSDGSGSALPESSRKPPGNLPRELDLPLPEKSPPPTGAPRLAKESAPILLHCSKSDADGKSFRSEIIHSDSFLKYCTPIKVTHSKLRSLFKCNSDIKFYPGRVCESSDSNEPFITFVLTPRQNETAGLPGNLVQVVQKTHIIEPAPETKEEEQAKVTLRDIEKFIAEMANFKRRAIQRQRQNANQKKASAVKFDTRYKTPPGPGDQSGSGTPRSPERKFYHECQRRKAQEQANAGKRTPTPVLRQKRSTLSQVEVKKSDEILDNLIRKTCLAVSNLFKNKYLEDQKAERLEKMKDKATGMSWSENRLAGVAQVESSGGHEEYENISVIPNELLQAIKLAIDQVDGLEGKEKIISAIEDVERKRSGREVDNRVLSPGTPPKKSKTIRIKIRCKGHKCPEKRGDGFPGGNPDDGRHGKEAMYAVAEVETVDAPGTREAEEGTLGSTNSTYFDALEKNEEAGSAAGMGGDGQSIGRPLVDEIPSAQFFTADSRSPASLTPSDEMLLATVSFEKEKEEIIYRKISKYLEEGKVPYSMTLLDVFLKKTENSLDDVDSRIRLNDLLSLVEKKSRNLMVNLEKNAWIKVLSLLEEATRVLDDEGIKHSKKTQLVEKIQSLNLEKLAELEELYSPNSPSSSNEYMRSEEGHEGSVLRLIRESLAFLKQKVVRKRSGASRAESPPRWDEDTESSESTLRVHSTNGFSEMRETPGGPNARYLKNKLRQQRARIERLINANGDLFSPKIEDLKNIVMMKMKSLEQYNMGESSKAAARPRYRASHTALDRKREGNQEGSRESLTRSPGYVDLVRYFMKAWDARMSLSSLSNCRI